MNYLKNNIDKFDNSYISSLNLISKDYFLKKMLGMFSLNVMNDNDFHSKYVTIVTWPLNMQITPLFIVQSKIIIL
jgi:hypothetical protein